MPSPLPAASPSAVSPLAPQTLVDVAPIEGVRFAAGRAGIRYSGRTDVMLAIFAPGTQVAGVFTRSKCPSAPVDWCRRRIGGGTARALLVNSGNANAFTGRVGDAAARASAAAVARALDIDPDAVFLASTGVIGEPLEAQKFDSVLPGLVRAAAPENVVDAARAIMTTDTFPKLATARATIDGVTVSLSGIAKGSGMIAPDMATMLAFVFTDAPIAAAALQPLLARATQGSFNAITVDSDTSTSDTLMIFATGAAAARGAATIGTADDPCLTSFAQALDILLLDLAHQVVRDGEGASKFVAVTVRGAETVAAARRIGFAIANSPLVKTAIAGQDANWGRVVMAVGKAGEAADRDRLAVWFGDIRVACDGLRDPAYDEAKVSAYMKGTAIDIAVDVGVGTEQATVWTCDLTKAYIAINGDYRS